MNRTKQHNEAIAESMRRAWSTGKHTGSTGYKHTDEARSRISEYQKYFSHRHRDDTKQLMSIKKSGVNHPLYGTSRSESTRKKISVRLLENNKNSFSRNKAKVMIEKLLNDNNVQYVVETRYDFFLPMYDIFIHTYSGTGLEILEQLKIDNEATGNRILSITDYDMSLIKEELNL